jgi:Ca2+-binding EF-hand superfamily protein
MTISGISSNWNTQDAATTQTPRPQGPPDPAKMAQKLFQEADANGDGKVTKDELAAAMAKHEHGGHHHHGGSKSGDSSGSGSNPLDALFSSADANGDGSLTEAELQAALQKRFQQQQQVTGYSQSGGTTTSSSSSSQTIGIA